MKAAALVLTLALAGCEHDRPSGAIERYQCTDAQMQKAQRETLFCKTEANYLASYCYRTAIMRNCDPKRTLTDRPVWVDAAPNGYAKELP